MSTVLRSDDGKPLEIKQGVILEPEGDGNAELKGFADERVQEGQPSVHAFSRTFSASLPRVKAFGPGAFFILIPLALIAGIAVIAIGFFVLAIFLISKLFSTVFSHSK